jgi:hypothetical protein
MWSLNFPQALAADWVLPVSQEELEMTREPKAPGAPAIYLYRQVDRDDATGREVNFARIKILTEEGRKYADMEIPFDKREAKVHGIHARTIQPDGTTIEFNGTIYEKTIVKARGVQFLAKTFTLPDVRVGTVIDYSYSIELNAVYVYNSLWILSQDLFTKNAKFSLKQNPNFSLRWSWSIGLPEGTKPPVKDGHYVRLETQNVPAVQVEDFMPPENTVKLRVEFTYSAGTFEGDQTKFWNRYGKAQYETFDSFINKRKAMERAVAQMVSPGDTPEAKLQKIYARVLQVRNLTFEREKSAQEEKRAKQNDTNNNVEDVWKRGYGYARDINWLFVALARAAGIQAESVLISSRASYFFDPSVLNSYQLNADVVLAKLPGNDLYLDPGAKFAPFGLLPWHETQVKGMLLDKDGGQWVTTSLPSSASAKIERQANLTLSDDGTLEGKLIVTFGGLEALELRTEQRDEDSVTRKATLEDLIKEAVPTGIEVELTNQPDWTSPSPVLVAEYHVKVPGWASGVGRRVVLPVGLFSSTEKHLFEHAARVHPVYFHHAYVKIDDITISLPVGWKIGSTPAPIHQDTKAVAYILKSEDNKDSLHIGRTLKSELLMVNKEQYKILRQFFQFVRTGDEEQVVLQPIS